MSGNRKGEGGLYWKMLRILAGAVFSFIVIWSLDCENVIRRDELSGSRYVRSD